MRGLKHRADPKAQKALFPPAQRCRLDAGNIGLLEARRDPENPLEDKTMTQNTHVQSDGLEMRELSIDEIEAASGAGIRDVVRFIKCLFGGCGAPQPPRGPHNNDGK